MKIKKVIVFGIIALAIPVITIGVGAIDQALVNRLKGRILLQVQQHGEAWYVDPVSGKRYYMKDGNTAYQMLHQFGLGITDADLTKIPIGTLGNEANTLQRTVSAQRENISLRYSREFTVIPEGDSRMSVAPTPSLVAWDPTRARSHLLLYLPQEAFPGTNFVDAYVMVNSLTSIDRLECLADLRGRYSDRDWYQDWYYESVNGQQISRFDVTGVAAGTTTQERHYRSYPCTEILLSFSTGGLQNYDPSLNVQAVNEAAVWSKLNAVLGSAQFTAK